MKKLEDISKKEIFNVPDGYFDQLPTIIQTRIAVEDRNNVKNVVFRFSLTYALPAIIILIVATWRFYPSTQNYSESDILLSEIKTEDLVVYLDNDDLTTDEIIEYTNFSQQDIHNIETQAYKLKLTDNELNNLYEYD